MLLRYWDMISANNAQYCDKESTSGGHFLYRAFLKMAVANTPILQDGSNFPKKATKKIILPLNFQKVRFEGHHCVLSPPEVQHEILPNIQIFSKSPVRILRK